MAKRKTENEKPVVDTNVEAIPDASIEEPAPVKSAPVEKPEPKVTKPIVPKEIDLTQTVVVKNGFNGTLVYRSRKTGERFVWEGLGTEQDMEIGELRNAKNSNKKFFEKNWFMFEEDWIVKYLGVERYYQNALTIDEFMSIFDKPASEIGEIIDSLSEGQKHSLAYYAMEKIADGSIDSNKTIKMLEERLGVELIER